MQEKERLYRKFHPHADTIGNNSPRRKILNAQSSPITGILKKPASNASNANVISCSPSSFPGRLTLKSAFSIDYSQDDLSIHDQEKCNSLLENYRKVIINGEICAGDCPNDGISCSTGVCRAHLR